MLEPAIRRERVKLYEARCLPDTTKHMAHFLAVFSPETHARFTTSDQTLMGFRERQRKAAARVNKGDVLVCYMTLLSRWVGLLRVERPAFEDSTPRFVDGEDPFIVRVPVKPLAWLAPEHAVPIHERQVWSTLSFTKEHKESSTLWTGSVRTSLSPFETGDGRFLERLLRSQAEQRKVYPLEPAEQRIVQPHIVRREGGEVRVSVPASTDEGGAVAAPKEARESIRVQTLLASIGGRMHFKVWVPPGDRARVLKEDSSVSEWLLDKLPLNYDTTTLQTIENIDVLWLKGRAMARAFEVEHTTAIYSGILRMADLLALQPNMDLRMHIVAPEARRAKVFEEIRRPVFSLLQGKPLMKRCSFLSYDAVRQLAAHDHLEHLSDSVLEEYEEEAEA